MNFKPPQLEMLSIDGLNLEFLDAKLLDPIGRMLLHR